MQKRRAKRVEKRGGRRMEKRRQRVRERRKENGEEKRRKKEEPHKQLQFNALSYELRSGGPELIGVLSCFNPPLKVAGESLEGRRSNKSA